MTQYGIIVVGAGPAGIAAATTAARSGCRVLLIDENPAPGGQIWRTGRPSPRSRFGYGERARSLALEQLHASGASLLFGHSVYDAPAERELRAIGESAGDIAESSATQSPALISLRYSRLILATGARERFLPFPGWTIPGVFGPGGLQALIMGGFEVEGKRVVVAGSGPLLLAVAAHLTRYGARVVCVVEQASISQLLPFAVSLWSHPQKIIQGIRYRAALGSARFHLGCWLLAALADKVSGRLTGVQLTDGKRTWQEGCDLLACGFHLVPNIELPSLLGCSMEGGVVRVDENQQTSISNIFCAGEPTGIGGLDAALVQGQIAGLACAGKPTGSLQRRRVRENKFAERLSTAFQLRPELRTLASPGTLVCRCEDVSFAALQNRSGWIDAKLQTRCGMGPCQGRICGAATDFLFGWKQATVRPPLTPVPVSALTSQHFRSMDIKESS